jgi:anion-transporting  ArsA/GET3 family ATPase
MDRLLNRPETRSSNRILREELDVSNAKVVKLEMDNESIIEALNTLNVEFQILKKKVAEMPQQQSPQVVVKKPQKCAICGREGHNARNSAFHPRQIAHVPGGLVIAHV